MHALATPLSPFQRKFSSRIAHPQARPLQSLPVLAEQAIADRSKAQNIAASALALALSAVLFAGLPAEVRAQTLAPQASSGNGSSMMVRVISSTPNLERITETRQQCSYETQQVVQPPVASQAGMSGTGGALLGALAGGLLASQVGKGNGKHVAIAAGSATGALIGKNMAEQSGSTASYPSYSQQQVQVCRPVSVQREQVRDYTVRYAYQGQEYTVNLPQHPGEWLKLTVSHGVTPI